ncbi:MAG: hypothetical protein ABSA05_15760 [Opitutaceae bacterium]|jgi:hypothetical protein
MKKTSPAKASPISAERFAQAPKIIIRLAPEELRRFCDDLASELQCDMPTIPADGDLVGTLRAWRRYSRRYEKANADRGSVELNRGTREMHDETASLLERLMKLLPQAAVA